MEAKKINFAEFYKFYLKEHQKMWTRIFHFVGTGIIILVIGYVLFSGKERFLWYVPILGFGLAWFSHAVFDKKFPQTYKHPFWSIISDFKMFFELLTGKLKFKE